MGSHHARVYAALTGACTLAGVYDPDAERAATLAERWDAKAYGSLEDMLRDVDVVSIASPAASTSTTPRWRSSTASTCWSRSRSR